MNTTIILYALLLLVFFYLHAIFWLKTDCVKHNGNHWIDEANDVESKRQLGLQRGNNLTTSVFSQMKAYLLELFWSQHLLLLNIYPANVLIYHMHVWRFSRSVGEQTRDHKLVWDQKRYNMIFSALLLFQLNKSYISYICVFLVFFYQWTEQTQDQNDREV